MLFRAIILRHFRSESGRLLLAIMGVTIGVALFVAVRLANTSALGAFSASLDAVAGRANLQVVSSSSVGLDERTIARLRQTRAVKAAAPVIEQYAQIDNELAGSESGTSILVFGVDILSERSFRSYPTARGDTSIAGSGSAPGAEIFELLADRGSIVITTKLARENGLTRGDSIGLVVAGRRVGFRVAGMIEPEGTASALGGNFALLDIATAQEAFDRLGEIDRIDLLVEERERAEIRDYLATILPDGAAVSEPERRSAQTLKMLDSFDLNLTALSFIALFVSMFIIYNTLLTTMLRRRRELGVLRALGATRGRIVVLFLGEAALIGVLGAAIGLPCGILLARLALDQVVATVSALYILTVVEQITIDPFTLLAGAGLGVLTSILSALPTALEASRVHPRETFSVQAYESRVSLRYGRLVAISIALLAVALLLSLQSRTFTSPLLGFMGAGFLLLGVALVTPLFIRGANRLFGRGIRALFGVEGELANAYLLQSLGRASTAIAALMTAIAMVVGVSTMIGSFRRTVEYWMRQTITADLYITTTSNGVNANNPTPMPPEVVRFVDSLPEVRIVDAVRRVRLEYGGRRIVASGARLNVPEEEATLAFIGRSWSDAVGALDTGAIAVSESFALFGDKEEGDTIVIDTPTGRRSLTIGAIYYDYTSDAGTIMMKNDRFARAFSDSSISNVALYLHDRSRMEEVRTLIDRKLGSRNSLIVYSNGGLRQEVLRVFDQTFAITYALQLVAIIVAAIGVANTLAALVVERGREIGILRSIGASATQVRKMTLIQAGLIAVASQILGTIAGLLLSAILIHVINRVSFGWTIQFQLTPDVLAISAALVVATAFVAAIAPANAAARKRVAEVVRAE